MTVTPSETGGSNAVTTTTSNTRRSGVLAALDQLVWAFQNFVALFSVSKFLTEALGDGGTALGAFAVVASILSLLTGSIMHAVGEYLGVANREEMQTRAAPARAALYRRSFALGSIVTVVLIVGGLVIGPMAPESLRDAFIWGGVASLPLVMFEATRVWLLMTRQVERAFFIDLSRLAVHALFTIALPLLGVPWSMAEIMLLWGGSAGLVVLVADGRSWITALTSKLPRLKLASWRRQARYGWDSAFYVGPEFATLWIMGALSSLALAGWFRLLVAAFIPANSFIAGLRALYLVPRHRDGASRKRQIIALSAIAAAMLIVNGLLAWFVPVELVARIVGSAWTDAHAGLPGLTFQRFASIFVVMSVLALRWSKDDTNASIIRRIWAIFVLAAAVPTALAPTLASAAWMYGGVSIAGAAVGAIWLSQRASFSDVGDRSPVSTSGRPQD